MTTILTRADIRSLYFKGEEAVAALIEEFQVRLIALEEQVAKHSGNSSKPPSSDGYKKKPLQPMTISLRQKTGKKVGGQPGHAGTTLEQGRNPIRSWRIDRTSAPTARRALWRRRSRPSRRPADKCSRCRCPR